MLGDGVEGDDADKEVDGGHDEREQGFFTEGSFFRGHKVLANDDEASESGETEVDPGAPENDRFAGIAFGISIAIGCAHFPWNATGKVI